MANKIAYTIGRTTSYDRGLIDATENIKTGKRSDYAGGWVFTNGLDAAMFRGSEPFKQAFKDNNPDPLSFSVYELELPTDWETDTYIANPIESNEYGVRHLLNAAHIVRKLD